MDEITRTKDQAAQGPRAFGVAAALSVAFAAAFLLFSAAPANAATTVALAYVPRFALFPGTATPSSASLPKAAPAAFAAEIHGPFSTTADECATCHRVHTAKDKNILPSASPQSTLCFTCHDGTGALTNVKATYSDPLVLQNIVADRKIYRHDTLISTTHTSARSNEFGGVSNRHSECSDCHDSHRANDTDSIQTPNGFNNSGRLAGSSGVSVVNGPAGSAPTYTYLPGGSNPITLEYQLCFKCHSGFTTLPSNGGVFANKPSRHWLDKGIEFNPANPSYHPVEAKGKNTSAKMAASLAGTSPYKQYTLTVNSVISCANCHSNYQKFNLSPKPALNASSPLHASKTPGILRQTYRNRVLMARTEAYDGADFALCYMCHSDTPFKSKTSTATNYDEHGEHMMDLAGRRTEGGTPDIDTVGGGRGNAVCAECHFRQHSTTNKIPGQTVNGQRLVSFATNVSAYNGKLEWKSTGVGTGTCTLTCHGRDHSGKSYGGAGW